MNTMMASIALPLTPKNRPRTWVTIFFTMLFALFISACQDEALFNNELNTETTSHNTQEEQGELTISLTDAPGDFVSYFVDVQSITLTKANGNEVQTLPLSTRIDFSQYVELTEFLTAATVPHGIYKKATMVIDYQNSDIQVEDESGNTVRANVLIDLDGNPITTQTLKVQLDNHNALTIGPGIPAHLTLDFDLNASHKVEFDATGAPIVTVEPILIASVDPETSKTHRARGALKAVYVDRSAFEIFIRPFLHRLKREEDKRFGTLKIQTNEDTIFEINDETYSGNEGLAALKRLPKLTAVVALGELKSRPRSFLAKEVRAGSSVAGGSLDAVSGTVLSRTENNIIVKGATLTRRDGSTVFNDKISVLLADSTTVKRQLDRDGSYDIQDISVGQKVSILGTLRNNAATEPKLDASNGRVLMLLTRLRGTALLDPETPETLAMKLRSINRHDIPQFDFTGTGVDTESDATPENYELDTGSLDVSSYANSDPLKVSGFVTPYGEAPVDFSVQTIVSMKNISAIMVVNWRPASVTPFSQISADKLVLNLTDSGKFHHVAQGKRRIDLTTLNNRTSIIPADADKATFIIQQAGSVQIHSQFATFARDIQNRLDAGSAMTRLQANGEYNKNTSTLTTKRMKVRFK